MIARMSARPSARTRKALSLLLLALAALVAGREWPSWTAGECPELNIPVPRASSSGTMKSSKILVAACLTTGACDLCGPEIVQVGAMPGYVRLRNTCPDVVELDATRLRFGLSYTQSVLPLAGSLLAGGCRKEGVLGLPESVLGAFGVALFPASADVLTATPESAVIWGSINTKLRDEHGQIGLVDAAKIDAGTVLTRGSAGWYPVPATSGVPCGTWGQTIAIAVEPCMPRLVEVHPGASSAFLKVALPSWCAPVALDGYALSWGRAPVDHIYQLTGTLAGGDQLVVGPPVTAEENGWPQWSHPGFLAAPEVQPVSAAHSGLAFAVLLHDEQPVQGVAYGPATVPHPVLQEFPGGVPGGRSLRWYGAGWEIGPASPNQSPAWSATD